MRTLSSLVGYLTIGLHVLVPLLGLILVAIRVRGVAQRLAIAGCAVLVGTGLLQGIWVFAAPRLIRALGGASAYATVSAILSLAAAIGLALVIVAVIAGRTTPQPPVLLPPPSNPYQQRPAAQPDPRRPDPRQGPYAQNPYPQNPYPQPPGQLGPRP